MVVKWSNEHKWIEQRNQQTAWTWNGIDTAGLSNVEGPRQKKKKRKYISKLQFNLSTLKNDKNIIAGNTSIQTPNASDTDLKHNDPP